MLTVKLTAILAVILFIIYRKLKKIYTFWERKGVKGPKPLWLVGNVLSILRRKESVNSLTQKICYMYPNDKVVGIYLGLTPTLILNDLNIVRKVLIKDFATFSDRGLKISNEKFSDHIFLAEGETWKVYRQKLYPLFSTNRMKTILPIVTRQGYEFINYIENLPPGPKELRMLDHKLSVKFLMSTLYGLEVDTFNEDLGDLGRMGYHFLRLNVRMMIGAMLQGINEDLPDAIGFKLASTKVEKVFMEIILNKSMKARKDNPNQDETVLDFLMKLKEQGAVIKEKRDGVVKVDISESVITGHASLFYASGFESYVSASFLLFELALNQHVQDRCYKEIVQVLKNYNGDFTFEATEDMQYLNMAFYESLRKYPSAGFLSRKATKDYHFEDINLTIEKGIKVIVPVQAIHEDPRYFPNPEVFDPERFSPENKKMIPDCAYLPFGDGPRKCIGYRQGRFQSLLLVAQFLHKFKVTPCEKTVSKVRFVPDFFSMFAQDGLWVNISKREQ